MAIRERVYTVDDVWRLDTAPERGAEKYCRIDGELIRKMPPAHFHASAASEISRHLGNFAAEQGLGRVFVECSCHPPDDRGTVLLPGVSFESWSRMADGLLTTCAPYMPDIAVEIISPSPSMDQARRKAQVYLRHGGKLAWLVNPVRKLAEVWRLGDDGANQQERVAAEGRLDGEDVLPGLALPLARILAG